MPKVEINQVAEIMKRNKADSALLRAVVEEMNLIARADANEEKAPALKKQFVIVVSDPDGRFPNEDFAGWVLQIPDNESPVTTMERVFRASYEFNASKKGRLLPVKTVGEALESVPAKHFKEAEVWVKSKNPVLVLRSDNIIPKDTNPARADDDDQDDEEPAEDKTKALRKKVAKAFKKSLTAEGVDSITISTGTHAGDMRSVTLTKEDLKP
jgi:hypothetical protein